MAATPDVSFVVPVRNEADYLSDCLESIAALETDYEYETIVVDGASSDATADGAREHGRPSSRGRARASPRAETSADGKQTGSGWPSSTPTPAFGRTT